MLDRRTGEFIKEIPLRSRAHVGGLAYDPVNRNLWVSGGSAGAAKAIAYSIDSLENYSLSREKKSIKSKLLLTVMLSCSVQIPREYISSRDWMHLLHTKRPKRISLWGKVRLSIS